MKKRLMLGISVVAIVASCWALWALACDQDKQTSAQAAASGAKVTAVVAGHSGCSSAAAAACKAHGAATTASMSGCPYHDQARSTTADAVYSAGASSCAHGASAVTASNGGHQCGGGMKGATASLGREACNSKFMGAGMMGAPNCGNRSVSAMTAEMHGECDACSDMVTCSNELSANGVQTQIVPLKNGVMFVFTSDTPAHVRAVQNALARRNDRLNALAMSGDRAHLCPECKNVRGALASGKMTRETVNIEGGCLTLVTSTDPTLITRLRSMASASSTSGRNKI